MKRPYWLCMGWPDGLWCGVDNVCHALHIKCRWICDRHDAALVGEMEATPVEVTYDARHVLHLPKEDS